MNIALISNRLSIWTLPAFACALVNFLVAQGLIVAGLTWPAQPVSAPGTLIAVHLLVIGWLLLLMLGALFQFVPVITSRPLPSQPLALAALAFVEIGLAGMVGGFLGLSRGSPGLAIGMPAGGASVIVGVLIACWNVGVPLARSRPLSLPGRMALTGLAFLTWLSRYGNHLGRGGVMPRVQDLVRESRSYPWFALYFIGVFLGSGFALTHSGRGFRSCIAIVTLATFGLVTEYWKAWRGHYVHTPRTEPVTPPFQPNPRG